MAQRSRFFDSSGGDRIYTSDAWAQVLGAIIRDGVVAAGTGLAVAEASPPAMSARSTTGTAVLGGAPFQAPPAPGRRPITGPTPPARVALHPPGGQRGGPRPPRRPPRQRQCIAVELRRSTTRR